MKRSFSGDLHRLVRSSWTRTNARFRIVATDEESAYYAWVDEYLDRLAADAAATKPTRGSRTVSTFEDVAAG
jgi:hypothetical protein